MTTNILLLPFVTISAETSQDGDIYLPLVGFQNAGAALDITGITFVLNFRPLLLDGTPDPHNIAIWSSTGSQFNRPSGQYLSSTGAAGTLLFDAPVAIARNLPVNSYVADLLAVADGFNIVVGQVTLTHAAMGPCLVTSIATQVRNGASANSVGYIPGPIGLSAYQIWLGAGNTGTLGQFLASLVGPPADTTALNAATATAEYCASQSQASATLASESATAAQGSAAGASTSANQASGSAGQAAASATTASSEAAVATSQAGAAAISATSAASSATAAAGSATSASTSAANTAALLASFRSAYLGAFATDAAAAAYAATNGMTLTTGVMYENTAETNFRIYLSGAWQDFDASAEASQAAASLSAANAAGSASTAQTAAATATTQAGNASTSAANAANSANAAATSATSAAGSASTATTEAGIATTQAGNASTSATAAAGSATAASTAATTATNQASAASTSATNAANSATASANSATSAAGSASTATTEAGIATTQAGNAGTSATAAAGSATAASTAATTATNQASAASTSATNAAGSATAAAGSASAAGTQATNASNSATSAAGSAAAAATSATNAAASATTAQNYATGFSIGTVSAGTAAATITGSPGSQKLNLVIPTSPYTLPAATSSALGGVEIGGNLTVSPAGVLSLSSSNVTAALGYTPLGASSGYLLDGVSPSAQISVPRGVFRLQGADVPITSLLSFSSGQKYTQNASGGFQLYAANGPAYDWSTGTKRLLVEAIASTNYNLNSESASSFSALNSAQITTAPGGLGTANLFTLTGTQANSCIEFAAQPSLSAGQSLTVSASLKAIAGNVTNAGIFVSYFIGSAYSVSAVILSGPGTVSLSAGNGFAQFSGLSSSTPTRVALTITNTSSSSINPNVYLFPGQIYNNQAGQNTQFGAVQFEYGPIASSYIPCGSSATSRVADVVKPSSALLALLQGSAMTIALRGAEIFNYALESGSVNQFGWAGIIGGSATQVQYDISGANGYMNVGTSTNTNYGVTAGTAPVNNTFGIAFNASASGYSASNMGSTVVSNTTQPFASDGTTTQLCYSFAGGGAYSNMLFDEIVVWPFAGDAAGLQAQARAYQ